MTKKHDLVIISNRLPVQIENKDGIWLVHPGSGGLVTALSGVREQMPFVWVGWPGYPVEEKDKEVVTSLLQEKLNYVPIFLGSEQMDHFYDGFCNSVLWPLFHYLPGRVDFDLPYWDEYKKVNEQFAQTVLPLCAQNATVWIHDYHLFLLPDIIKKQRPDLNIGFFLHIPFPSSEIYRLLPVRREILCGILASDLIGFHTYDYGRHFASSCQRVLGAETTPTEIRFEGHKTRFGSYPIGINIRSFQEALAKPQMKEKRESLADKYAGLKIILGVDRIDYTKGLPLKLKAYEFFLEQNPELRGKVMLIQVGIPSRLNVKEYQQIKNEVDQLVGKINGRFGNTQYSPIRYIAHNVSFDDLSALYERADVLLVTPIRDGMNLVSLEYAACQKEGLGVIILSEFAGSSKSMGGSILVNPWDTQQTAKAISEALHMNENDRSNRALQNYIYVKSFHSLDWARKFLHDLASKEHSRSTPLNIMSEYIQLKKSFQQNIERFLFLDYDGTLVDFSINSADAKPTDRLLELLGKIGGNPKNHIYVISGRSKDDLEKWFGHLNIGLAAEHGLFLKNPGSKTWNQREKISMQWFFTVEQILKDHTCRVPGSSIERKQSSLVWHYRQADEKFGEWQALELTIHLDSVLSNYPVSVIQGNKIIEVRPQGIDKGSLTMEVLKSKRSNSPFILCLGDDQTDEDMFQSMPRSAWTCKIGDTIDTKARHYLQNPQEVVQILEELADIP